MRGKVVEPLPTGTGYDWKQVTCLGRSQEHRFSACSHSFILKALKVRWTLNFTRQGTAGTSPCRTGFLHVLSLNGLRWTDLAGYCTVRADEKLRLFTTALISKQCSFILPSPHSGLQGNPQKSDNDNHCTFGKHLRPTSHGPKYH